MALPVQHGFLDTMTSLMITTESSAKAIESWCRDGFIQYQRRSYEHSREARTNFYEHLCNLTQLKTSLPHETQKILETINTFLREETPLGYCHKYPLQSFILINKKLSLLGNAHEFSSLSSIDRIQQVYRDFLAEYQIPDREENLQTPQPSHRIPLGFQTVSYEDKRPISPNPPRAIRESRDGCLRKCSWAKQLCQAIQKKFLPS